jgi:hypothetical protein
MPLLDTTHASRALKMLSTPKVSHVMKKRSLDSIEKAVLYSFSGSQSSLLRAFIDDVGPRLSAAGFRDSLDAFHIPSGVLPRRRKARYRAAGGPVELLIGVSLFIGASIGSWAVKKVCDEVFEKKIRPGYLKLKARFSKKGTIAIPRPLKFQLGIWYDVDQVYVQVIVEVSTPEEFDCAEQLILAAQKAALNWVEVHGVTQRVITYRVKHGEMSQYPALSDTVESCE